MSEEPIRPPNANSVGNEPVEKSRHLIAFLFTLRKAHAEMEGEKLAIERASLVHTKSEASAYAEEIIPKLWEERIRRRNDRKHKKV